MYIQTLDDMNFLYVPNPKYIPSLRNKVFDLLIVVFVIAFTIIFEYFKKNFHFIMENPTKRYF